MRNLLLLLVGLTLCACSKKDDPASTPNTGSYQRDGQTVYCTATARLMQPLAGLSVNEILQVTLTTTPQPADGPEVLYANFYRLPGGSVSSFHLVGIVEMRNGSAYASYNPGTYSLASTSGGGYSGSFAGTSTSPGTSTITGGVFTDVRL